MQRNSALLLLVSGVVALACACVHSAAREHNGSSDGSHRSHAREDDAGEDEKEVALADLPPGVKAAAMKAVPGLVLEEASVETEKGRLVYTLEGKSGDTEYELELDADGRILESHGVRAGEEREDEDDEDEGDDDEGDEGQRRDQKSALRPQ